MPDGSAIKVKAGTQRVDRAWRFIKARPHKNQKVKAGSKRIRARIRSAQYEYWCRTQCLHMCRKCKM